MENKNYNVGREDIYVGEVVRTDRICRSDEDNEFFRTNLGELYITRYFSYRSMLFVPNKEKLACDLLYQSPNYPILNITDDETCLNLGKNSVVIKDACNLESLLKYYGYSEYLTIQDIIEIRKKFFTGRFAKDNCELFGWKESMAEDVKFYSHDKRVTDPKELEKLRKKYRARQQAGHRLFFKASEGTLPDKYWDVLDDRGDRTLVEAIQWHEKMNAFLPDKQEGLVKKLTRF